MFSLVPGFTSDTEQMTAKQVFGCHRVVIGYMLGQVCLAMNGVLVCGQTASWETHQEQIAGNHKKRNGNIPGLFC